MRIHTLRGRLYFLLAQWLVVYLGASFVIGYWSLERFRHHVEEDRLLLARTVAQYLSSSVLSALQSGSRMVSELPAVDGRAVAQLRAFRFQGPFRDAVHLVDAGGRAVVSDPPFARLPEIDWEHYRDRMGVTGLLRDGSEPPVLALVVPFRSDGEEYFLVAEMKPRGSPLSVYLQNLAPAPDIHVVVVDDSASVIAAPDHTQLYRVVEPAADVGSRVLARRSLVAATSSCALCADESHDGRFLTVMVPLRIAPWGVVIQQDERRAFSVLRTSQAGLLVTTGLLVVMGVLLSRGLSRSVIDPVQELSRKTAELEVLSSQRRVLVRRLLAAGEEERRRIARELHDEISQLLTVVQLSLEHAGEGPAAGELDLDKVRSLLARTQKEVHRVIHDLRPSLLDDLGLAPAVRWYAASYLEPEGIDASLEVDDALELPEEVEITTFRIYQEIVTNILRHSKADHVSVELYREDGRLILAVEDDGVGFAAGDPAEGAGLVGIRERAALVGGRVDIDSEPGMGTHVRLEIPL
jgi:signal transduction histidine kinase